MTTSPGSTSSSTTMTPDDAALLHSFVNLMSDDLLRCTVIHDEREVFYDSRIRLHGSMFSRPDASGTGFTLKFPSDHLYRGSRASVVVRRSDLGATMLKHVLNQAGGLPANYNDVVYLVSHRPDNVGPATLDLANYDFRSVPGNHLIARHTPRVMEFAESCTTLSPILRHRLL